MSNCARTLCYQNRALILMAGITLETLHYISVGVTANRELQAGP